MRIAKAALIMIGSWVLLFPGSHQPLLPTTTCGWALAQARLGEAWYGVPIVTTEQAITILDAVQDQWDECQLVAAVSLHFGDYEKVFTEAFPVLQRYRTPATTWIVTGRIGQPGYMTLEQIKELARNNWEIGSHGATHQPLVESAPETAIRLSFREVEIRAELERAKISLEREGFSVSGFLSPFGLYNDLALEEIQRVYSYHRSNIFNAINPLPLADHGPYSRWELVYFQVKQNTPPLEVIIEIDRVHRRGGLLILDFHDMGDYDPSISYPPEALERIIRFMRVELKMCTLEELQRGLCQERR